jgi:hypothetical protein
MIAPLCYGSDCHYWHTSLNKPDNVLAHAGGDVNLISRQELEDLPGPSHVLDIDVELRLTVEPLGVGNVRPDK